MSGKLEPIEFAKIRGWADDDHLAAFDAFCVSARRMVDIPYKTRELGVDAAALADVAAEALKLSEVDALGAKTFFEDHFVPHRLPVLPEHGTGFVTAYFEPEVSASRTKNDAYPFPLYRKPPELVEISDAERPSNMDPYFRFARKTAQGFEEYFNRGEIQSGALDGRDLELVWLAKKTDAFFIHIQGSARLVLDDGEMMRVTYAAKTGHPYTSLGKVLIKKLNVSQATVTMDYLRDWMDGHPDEIDDFMALNNSYIFLEEVIGLNPGDGPIAAAKVPLVEGRSLAVDRTLHTFGSPVWVATEKPLPHEDKPAGRLMIAHDTGSAIVGTARGDIFIGTGHEAGLIAGKVQHAADMIVLVPRGDSAR